MSHYVIGICTMDSIVNRTLSSHGDLDVLLGAGGQVPAAPREVLLNALPSHRGVKTRYPPALLSLIVMDF